MIDNINYSAIVAALKKTSEKQVDAISAQAFLFVNFLSALIVFQSSIQKMPLKLLPFIMSHIQASCL